MTPDELEAKVAARKKEVTMVVSPGVAAPGMRLGSVVPTVRNETITVVPIPFPSLVVPKRYASVDFTGFVLHTPSQKLARNTVETFVGMVAAEKGPMLALVGGTGVGKSHLLYAAAKMIHSRAHRVVAGAWNHNFADALRYGGVVPGRPHITVDNPVYIREALYNAPVLMVDEIERTASTDFDAIELKKLACHFWEHEKPMMLTTNVHPLADLVGEAVASRFTVVVITGPDHRKDKP